MASLTVAERLAFERIMLARRIAAVGNRVCGSRILRFRRSAPAAETLLLVPRELRPADPTFAGELAAGLVGLAGETVELAGRSAFEISEAGPHWRRTLHGFGWLRHLSAARDAAARTVARDLVREWIRRYGARHTGLAWDADVAGRRLMSWLYNADLLLNETSEVDYSRMMGAISAHVAHIAINAEAAADGVARLTALAGLTMAAVVLEGHERLRERCLAALAHELDRQVMADGCHVSRNPGALIEPLVDLLSLVTCLRAERLGVPDAIEAARVRALGFLRFMRTADGSLARFNGTSSTPVDRLPTLFSHTEVAPTATAFAAQGRYGRLAAAGVVLHADLGAAPALLMAGAATASALAVEFGIDGEQLFENVGAGSDAASDPFARHSASHNTLVLATASSARLVDDPAVQAGAGAPAMIGPPVVEIVEAPVAAGAAFAARHDGYLGRFGLWHTRRVEVGGQEALVYGEDRLDGRGRSVRLARDISFSIHFHVTPDVRVSATSTPGSAALATRHGRRYTFSAEGAALSVEESAGAVRPDARRPSRQIVLRGASFGESRIVWRLRRD